MRHPRSSLAIFGGLPALEYVPSTRFPVTDELLTGLKALIETHPLSTLFGDGEVRDFEMRFAEYCGTKHAIAVSSGTAALHTALSAARIGPGDDVAVMSFSFIASASVIVQAGARPVFIDIDPATLAIDINDLKARLTDRTKAVIVAHLFGIPADIVELSDFCKRRQILLIEDACQALGARVGGAPIGSFGDIGCFSFNVKKIVQTGEGGMIVTNHDDVAEAAREIRVNGLSIFGVERLGFNYTLTNLQACLGIHQVKKLPAILATRRAYADRMRSAIRDYASVFDERRPDTVRAPYAVPFKIPLATRSQRDVIVEALAKEGVPISGVYSVLYHHDRVFGAYLAAPCREAERIVPRILSVNPSHLYSQEDVDRVCLGLGKVLSNLNDLLALAA